MEYFEKGKTYTFEEIQEIYKNASAREMKNSVNDIIGASEGDPMFGAMLSMIVMQTLAHLNNRMFENNKENKEN